MLPVLLAANFAPLTFVATAWSIAAVGATEPPAITLGALAGVAAGTAGWWIARHARVVDLPGAAAWVFVPLLTAAACFWAGCAFPFVLGGGIFAFPVGLLLGVALAPVGGVVSAVALGVHLHRARERGGTPVPSTRSSELPGDPAARLSAYFLFPGLAVFLHTFALPFVFPQGAPSDSLLRVGAAPVLGLLAAVVWRIVLVRRMEYDWRFVGLLFACSIGCGVGGAAVSLAIAIVVSAALPTTSAVTWSLASGVALGLFLPYGAR